MIAEANDIQIQSIESLHKAALIEGRGMAKERRKKLKKIKGIRRK